MALPTLVNVRSTAALSSGAGSSRGAGAGHESGSSNGDKKSGDGIRHAYDFENGGATTTDVAARGGFQALQRDNADYVVDTQLTTTPSLTCLPNTITKNEPALIFWQCNNDTTNAKLQTKTQSLASSLTDIHTVGKKQVNPTTDTTYTISCGTETQSCDITVIQPVVGITADERTVEKYKSTTLRWDTLDIDSCILTTNDTTSRYKNWKRSCAGDSHGACSAITHPITKDTTFTLTCITKTGMTKKKEIEIKVE